MIKCCVCENDIVNENKSILVSPDGDFVCSRECEKKHDEERERFFREIVHSPEKCEKWLLGKE
jgi:hypothetical protein